MNYYKMWGVRKERETGHKGGNNKTMGNKFQWERGDGSHWLVWSEWRLWWVHKAFQCRHCQIQRTSSHHPMHDERLDQQIWTTKAAYPWKWGRSRKRKHNRLHRHFSHESDNRSGLCSIQQRNSGKAQWMTKLTKCKIGDDENTKCLTSNTKLAYAVMAKNSVLERHVYRPFQLVFGVNQIWENLEDPIKMKPEKKRFFPCSFRSSQ